MSRVATVECPIAEPSGLGTILRAPYGRLAASDLLSHFRRREGVRFFAVPDPDETRREKIDAILENRFELGGEAHQLPEPIPWRFNPSDDVEWHILLHKFYYSVGLGIAFEESGDPRYLEKWVSLTSSWIDQQVPNGYIAADVTGRRVQNWIYSYLYFVVRNDTDPVPAEFHRKLLASLHDQVAYLRDHLAPERNHRTLELYAIFLASVVFPEMRQAPAWRAFSLGEIVNNMEGDLLADGVQCELSTDYHHLVLKSYLCVRRLARLNGIAVPRRMDQALLKALEFSLYVHKPDGVVPSLSDGDARSYLDLLAQGAELFGREDLLYVATRGARGRPPAKRSAAFPASGYTILRSGWGNTGEPYEDERYLVFDCGSLGAGNHGHLDLLSFEMAAYGRSLIVDPGRYTYSEAGENWRVRFRGTAYHNTVLVDGANQTRYRKGKTRFKIQGPAAEPELRELVSEPGFDLLHGVARSHEYEAVHERRIFFLGGQYWLVSDVLTGKRPHRYDLLFHLSELAQSRVAARRAAGTQLLLTPGLVLAHAQQPGTSVHLDDGFVSYRYGEKHPAPIVRWTRRGRQAAFHTVLYPHRREIPEISLRRIPVYRSDASAAGSAAQALEITITLRGRSFTDVCFFAPAGASRPWRFGDFRFSGSYLVLRQDENGAVRRVHCSSGAVPERAGRPIRPGRVEP